MKRNVKWILTTGLAGALLMACGNNATVNTGANPENTTSVAAGTTVTEEGGAKGSNAEGSSAQESSVAEDNGASNAAEDTTAKDETDSSVSISKDGTVTVTASGTINVVPDVAEITFGISSDNADLSLAQEDNNTRSAQVKSTLEQLGVDDKDIQTTDYYIYPQYDYNTGDGSQISGYSVQQTLVVKNLKIEEAGNVVTQCVSAGINNMTGINYTSSKYDETYQQALADAMNNARTKADALAASVGGKVTEVETINEGYQDNSPEYRTFSMAGIENAKAADSLTFQPGETGVTATVTVQYKIG